MSIQNLKNNNKNPQKQPKTNKSLNFLAEHTNNNQTLLYFLLVQSIEQNQYGFAFNCKAATVTQ